MFEGDEQRGKRTLSSLSNFRAGATINLINRGHIMEIYGNSKNFPDKYRPTAKFHHHTLAVGELDTIGHIKTMLEGYGLPAEQQILMFNDEQLEDSKTPRYYNIKEKSTLQVYHKSSCSVAKNIGKYLKTGV